MPPYFDPGAAFPELSTLRTAAATGDWRTVWAFFGDPRYGRLHDTAIWIIGETEGVEHALEPAVAAHPVAALPRLLLAARWIEVGWAIRSDARAQHVSREQFDTFHDYLRRAERLLLEVTARDPDDVRAWVLRLITVRGLELGQSEARRRYDQAARRDPCRLPAQVQLLQQLCPKWSGSWEKTHAFARECAATAPPGAPNALLVAEAHIEHWLELPAPENAEYLRRPDVRAEVFEAAARSVLHPHSRPLDLGWRNAHSTFAMIFSVMGEPAAAAPHFRALGNLAYEAPWYYLGDPATAFREHRANALAGG